MLRRDVEQHGNIVAGVMADQYGVLHAPFATGRAFLSELGAKIREGMRVLFHEEVVDEEGREGRLEVTEMTIGESVGGAKRRAERARALEIDVRAGEERSDDAADSAAVSYSSLRLSLSLSHRRGAGARLARVQDRGLDLRKLCSVFKGASLFF